MNQTERARRVPRGIHELRAMLAGWLDQGGTADVVIEMLADAMDDVSRRTRGVIGPTAHAEQHRIRFEGAAYYVREWAKELAAELGGRPKRRGR